MSLDLISACLSEGIHFIDGEPGSIETLRRVALQRADSFYAVSMENATNVASTVLAHRLTMNRQKPLRCYVAIADPDLSRALIARFLGTPSSTRIELNLFNEIELSAHVLLDQAGLSSEVTVVGLGELGQAVVIELVRRWYGHYRLTGETLGLSLVDEDAPRVWDQMKARGLVRQESCDVRLVTASVESLRASTLTRPSAPDWWGSPEHTFVCTADTDEALAIGLGVAGIGASRARVTVCVDRYGEELHEVFQSLIGIPSGSLSVFSIRDAAWMPSFIRDGVAIERIARSLHQRYIETRLAEGDFANRLTLCTWERLPERFRESNRNQARHIGSKLSSIGCYLLPVVDDAGSPSFDMTADEIEGLAQAEHVRWMAERSDKQVDHPDMVDWDRLSELAREKDRVFARAIPGVLANIGYKVVRKTA
jgi:hypothetical protein